MKLETIILLPLIFTGCANYNYNPEDKNIEWKYQTAEYEIRIQPQIKDGYGAKIIYEF